jgi:ankyrin repeat protein
MDRLLQSGGNADDIVLTSLKNNDRSWGQSAMYESAKNGHKSLLEFVLNSGFDVNAVLWNPNFDDFRTLIHVAPLYSQEGIVRFLIERGADMNILSRCNNTALHLAAQANNVGIITLLLDKGVSVNIRKKDGQTPLHQAALCGNVRGTEVLVRRGADLEGRDRKGRTPLMSAAFGGKLEIVRYLVGNGADINVFSATESALLLATKMAHLDVMCLLLDYGADINGTNTGLDTPLQRAILKHNLQTVKYFIERGADVNLLTCDGHKNSTIEVAILTNKLEIIDCLIEPGANLNARDRDLLTPLYFAVVNNKTASALHLVEKGADLNIPDSERETIFYYSVHDNNIILAKHFIKFGSNLNYQMPGYGLALEVAILHGNIHMVNILIDGGADINLRDNYFGNTELHDAVRKSKPGLVHYFIDRGADINIPNNKREPPPHWILKNQWEILADHLVPDDLRPEIDKTLQDEMQLQRLDENLDS